MTRRRDDARPAQTATHRLDPLGKQALFESPVKAAPDTLRASRRAEGRSALFSIGPRESGTVVVSCSGCESRTRIGLGDAAVRLASFSRFDPLFRRNHPHRIKCPSCHEVHWCRIGWNE